MNLFLAGWRLDAAQAEAAVRALLRAADAIPQLDPGTAWMRRDATVVAAGVQTAPPAAEPRRYTWVDAEHLVTFDGLPVDPSGTIRGHDAGDLQAHWGPGLERLEGRFALVRTDRVPPSLEVVTDPFGLEHLFVAHRGPAWIVSNSASVAAAAFGLQALDPDAVAMFVTTDMVLGDRTLVEGVRVLPAGHRLRWSGDADAPAVGRTFRLTEFARTERRPFDATALAEVDDALGAFLARTADVAGVINSPISGGLDTRLLTALLVRHHVPSRFWTKGHPGSGDVRMGRAIAARLGVPHRVAARPMSPPDDVSQTDRVIEHWDVLADRLLGLADGMASLFLVANLLGQPEHVEHLEVTLSGLAGEIARAVYRAPILLRRDVPAGVVRRALPRMIVSHHEGLVTGAAVAAAERALRELVDGYLDDGWAPADVPDVLFLDQRVRRYAANNPHEMAPAEDKVLPFATRAFVGASFGVPVEERWEETIHRTMIEALAPGLLSEPDFTRPLRGMPSPARLERARWEASYRLPRSLRSMLAAQRRRIQRLPDHPTDLVPYEERAWFQAKRETLVAYLAGSSPSAPTWDVVDRRVLDRLMAPDVHVPERQMLALFTIASLCRYESRLRAALDDPLRELPTAV